MKIDGTVLGLYDADGNDIIKYNKFSIADINAIGISTGLGASGQWSIKFGPCLSKYFMNLFMYMIII